MARLDEARGTLHSVGTLVYTNNSPDTLRELFFHQYLNAFRPGSAWSTVDTREGRVRFQKLRDPDYGYERFTTAPRIDGTAVSPEYPGAPDSTVARFALPHPLAPGDSCVVTLEWDARPSTVLRRQGRRGRSYDFAQWYPKIAVYDRHGWEAPPFTPAGELYGEFGMYDVTLVLRHDQIVGATGVVTGGDPGWGPTSASPIPTEPGWKAVTFHARNVHHFAWSTSPDYRYEGGTYATPADTVAIHVLYRPGDEATWGRGIALRRTKQALAWLESIYGPYAYPQLTNVHRLEGGGTEFPMMIMDGSASQGLILHEAGHQFTYAILANNEWASAWMDEGLTEYQTEWAERLTRADRHRTAVGLQIPIAQEGIYPPRPRGYRALAATPLSGEREDIRLDSLDLMHRAEPLGWSAARFSEFGIYNAMVYARAVRMYGALRDVLGDQAWRDFLHQYYARWKFKHVDELAMRTEAGRAGGRDLSWFFDQWLRKIGLVEYELGGWTAAPDGAGWISNVTVVRRGPYLHPMPVAIRTADGWTFGRSEPLRDPDTVRVRTRLKPLEVRLDPDHLTEDWWRFDDADLTAPWFDERSARVVIDWPLLDQWREDRFVTAILPYAWYSDPGHLTPALRLALNYQGWLDRLTIGVAAPTGPSIPGRSHVQAWFTLHDPAVGAKVSPQIGISDWALDGIDKFLFERNWNVSPFVYANGPQRTVSVAFTATIPYDPVFIDPTRWERHTVVSISSTGSLRAPLPDTVRAKAFLDAGYVSGTRATRGYIRADASATRVWSTPDGAHTIGIRGFASYDARAPIERAVFLSASDPTETFADDYVRPKGAPLARDSSSTVHYTALGGAGLRGYDPRLAVPGVVALNAEATTRLFSLSERPRALGAYLGVFADAGTTFHSGPIETPALAALLPTATAHDMASHLLGDAGVGVALRGYVYDQDVAIRIDIPFLVAQPLLAAGRTGGSQVAAWRWTFSFKDLW